MKPQHQEVLEKYNYKKDKPYFSGNNYTVWHGSQNQTNLPVTIKIMKHPHIELPKYLKKLKEVRSQFVIKIFQVTADQSTLMFITEQVTYGTLKKGLASCEHLDQNDSLFVAKSLLNGHVDVLRTDLNWFGTEDDIEFTDTGIKLSWNNSCQFNLVNPFPTIIGKLVSRIEAAKGNSLLPFPEIKAINELIKICKENASQISLHPQMKQKIKFSRRKGKDWMGLREIKNKSEYFDELTYLAISKEHGLVRVKVYDIGKISPNLLILNKTKNTYTKVIDCYDEGDKSIIISEYSNDGNLQLYVKRLKSSGINLKEEHIQFFFYSLFEPLKNVQQSTLKSINMLNIKNIYIENGIPKIGEPIPMNLKIQQILSDRADVPDFYHTDFKKDPTSHSVNYDTYSLGVLLYKLMYTEYPIFPGGKVHIPTTPNYNKRLKTSLEIFLNEGGSLSDLEKKIEVSENVLKQVQQNKEKLMEGVNQKDKKKVAKKQQDNDDDQEEEEKIETVSKISIVQEQKNQDGISEQSDDEDGICAMILHKLKLKPAEKMKQTYHFLDSLQDSPYKKCRLWTKIILITALYVFMFYFDYLIHNVAYIAEQNLLQMITVTADGSSYNLTTSNYYAFTTAYNTKSQTVNSLQSMGCAIDSYQGAPVYSNTAYNSSTVWISFIVCGLISLILMLFIKAFQINVFDMIKAWNYRQNGKGKFNLTNFFIFSLMWQTLLAGHFFLFNFIYYGQSEPCLGFPNGIYGSTYWLFGGISTFMNIYMAVFISQFVFTIIYLILIGCNENFLYNKIINPVTIFGIGYFIFTLIVRFGAIFKTYYYPSAANDSSGIISGYFKSKSLMGILGVFPEIMLLLQILVSIIVDLTFWGLIDKSHSLLNNDASVLNDGLDDLV